MALNRTTIVSIIATTIIIGLSIGLTNFFNPERMTNLSRHHQNIIESDEMENRCNDFVDMMNQDTQLVGKNNVVAYNLQRLHGQCYTNVNNVKNPVELLKITGCSGKDFIWEIKQDSNIFDFCPNINQKITN